LFAPDLLYALWRRQLLTRDHLQYVLIDVWKYTKSPILSFTSIGAWRAMFRCAGFLSNGPPRPEGTITVYRGSTQRYRRGCSWTTIKEEAEQFTWHWCEDQRYGRLGDLYRAEVNPSDVLAMISRGRKVILPDGVEFDDPGESEVIVDARKIDIALVEEGKAIYERRLAEEREGAEDGEDDDITE
jgi:hypothetical protein